MKTEHAEAKQRLFDAAVSLFAREGYAAVGVREIAKTAGVNISSVSYYYGGKAGLLLAIIDETYSRYGRMLAEAGDDSTPAEEHVRRMVRGIVRFFRENTELGLVAFDSFPPVDDANTIALRVKWAEEIGARLAGFFGKLGLDTSDPVQMGVVRRSLPMSVKAFFEGIFALEQSGARDRLGPLPSLDDAFFEHYAEHLAELFLYGVTGMTRMSRERKSKRSSRGSKPRGRAKPR
ncbi:TetR family transcriptional regulator [candidate division WOR-3 bacterium]|uniref:TetR family transcriptional regulator n=1 Tax=candidate division WOR-3 bacterium TaxID=2052148 RepID=A0A937XBJ8_UNCW3|nr:TetR family transcriptional regulator [candidate division WOR-3 bacterium]